MPLLDVGPNSGLNTNKIIEDLVNVEKEPQRRFRQQQGELNQEVLALTELRKKTKILQDALKDLYSYNQAFEARGMKIFPEGIVEGTANKKAAQGSHSLKVLNIANPLIIKSRTLKKSENIAAASFTINETKRNFSGGSLSEFRDFLSRSFNDISVRTVQIDRENQALGIESKKSGAQGILNLSDDQGVFRQLELIGSPQTSSTDNRTGEARELNAVLSADFKEGEGIYFDAATGSFTLTGDQKLSVSVKSPEAPSGYRFAGWKFSAKKSGENGETDTAPSEITIGPVDQLNIKGIELETYNISRDREKPVTASGDDFGFLLGELKVSLKEKPYESGEALPERIDLYNTSSGAVFSAIRAVFEKIPENIADSSVKNEDLLKLQQQRYPHIVQPASAAELEMDGIRMQRETNSDLTDIIDGVTLNLKKASENPVEINVNRDSDKAKVQILDFVKKYNDLLEFAQASAKTAKNSEVGKYRESLKDTGILATNSSVRALVNGLKNHSSAAYPAIREPYIKVLASIGISTGKVGAKWEDIHQGLLIVDETQLQDALQNHPEAVKELFVIDSNGDNRPDSGFAFVTEKFLRPYTTFTRGLLQEQIKSKQERIEQLDKAIAKNEEHSESYRDKLKKKFGYMEGKVGEQKAIGNMLRNKLNTPQD